MRINREGEIEMGVKELEKPYDNDAERAGWLLWKRLRLTVGDNNGDRGDGGVLRLGGGQERGWAPLIQ